MSDFPEGFEANTFRADVTKRRPLIDFSWFKLDRIKTPEQTGLVHGCVIGYEQWVPCECPKNPECRNRTHADGNAKIVVGYHC